MKYVGILLVAVAILCPKSAAIDFQCGDINSNGNIDVADLVALVSFMFIGGAPPTYPATADCDGTGRLDISDLVCWVDWMFGGGQNPPQCPITRLQNHQDISGGCLPGSSSRAIGLSMDAPEGYLYLAVEGNNLHVHHIEANYQCCLMYRVDWYQSGQVLTGFEVDTGALCDCYCDFDLESVLYGLTDGDYQVVLVGIEGDTVGTGGVTIPGDDPRVIDYGDSGCLEQFGARDSAVVDYSLSRDTLYMVHHNGWFNCGGIIATGFALVGDTLRFYEFNVSEDWLWCMCYFRVWATVVSIDPGTYVAEIYARDHPEEPIELIDRRMIVLGQ